MFLYHNPQSGMVHGLDWPPKGYFNETYCGARIPDGSYTFLGDESNVTCGACKYNMKAANEEKE